MQNLQCCLVQRHGIPACRKGIVSGFNWHLMVYAQADIMQETHLIESGASCGLQHELLFESSHAGAGLQCRSVIDVIVSQ